MRIKRWLVGLVVSAAAASPVQAAHQDAAIYQCKINGQAVFQDQPCAGAPVTAPPSEAPLTSPKKSYDEAALERKLDHLQALGVGLIQHAPPKAQPRPETPKPQGPDYFKPRPRPSWQELEQREEAITARLQAKAEHDNAVAAAQLSQDQEAMHQRCGEKLVDLPSVGMSDEAFRQCTMLARFGGITQIVVSEENGMPLRLYVFPAAKIRRVYAVDGVVTAIKP
jgi:hypothetical protein